VRRWRWVLPGALAFGLINHLIIAGPDQVVHVSA
jgi:hypothetical protein